MINIYYFNIYHAYFQVFCQNFLTSFKNRCVFSNFLLQKRDFCAIITLPHLSNKVNIAYRLIFIYRDKIYLISHIWDVGDAVPYRIVVSVSFGCRGGRPRPPVRCSMPTAVTPRNFTIYVRIFGTSMTPSHTTLFHLKLDKYIKYGTLYKTDNLVFYSLKRKYHLRLSEQTAFGFLLSKSTVTHPNIQQKKSYKPIIIRTL